ncbi:hypothetical protein MUY35_07565 [Aliiroseovarius sp. S1339]|uniref:hypothetical protein n=1 Tax=Aliiroseovarius sp. S1339 TaxID=2936990 RepID=UPI0020C1054B|nr:hypothetical protein [Aliiroseovarius sp. S1339]MCK8463704.1 hypothetical protein [Aliiroseovarius sp. S1339]
MFRILPLVIVAGGWLASPVLADVAAPGGKVIDCYCTDKSGSRIELGESICLFVDGRAFMARCEMSLNVPMWRETGKSCVSAQVRSEADFPASAVPDVLTPL